MTKPKAGKYDRSAEDLGNVVALEHVNLGIADQGLATVFYMSGLGLTRDPYMMTSIDNMWVNVGRSQFHLPTMAKAQCLRGRVGLVIPDREALLQRLGRVKGMLGDTRFAFVEHEDHVETTCPWGNRILCHAPSSRFEGMALGMAYARRHCPGDRRLLSRGLRDWCAGRGRCGACGCRHRAGVDLPRERRRGRGL